MPAQKNKDETVNQKIPIRKDIPFFEKLRAIKKKWFLIGGTILLLLLVGIMTNTSSDTSLTTLLSEPQEGESFVSGTVSDENGSPVDGARVVSKNHIAATGPDGNFTIPAETNERLTVSAFGYQDSYSTEESPFVTLVSLLPASVRILVVDPEKQVLADALVVRLNANTSAPVQEAVTDESGSALFPDIPSGQAAFVVLHPDYGIGWVEMALAEETFAQEVVMLQPLQGEQKLSKRNGRFIKSAYAQDTEEPAIELRDQLEFRLQSDIPWEEDYLYSEDSQTLVAVGFNQDKLQEYIRELSKNTTQSGLAIDSQTAQRVHEYFQQKGLASPVSTIRIMPFYDKYQQIVYEPGVEIPNTMPIEKTADTVVKTEQQSFLVEIKKPTAADAMAFLRREYEAKKNDHTKSIIVTSWSELEAAEAEAAKTGKTVYFDDPRRTVCCRRPDAAGGAEGDIPDSVSSNTAPPSNIGGETHDGARFTYNPVYETVQADLSNIDQIRQQNPDLTFSEDGKTYTTLDIPAPDPGYAPADFLLDFFPSGANAQSTFFSDPGTYQQAWQDYLYFSTWNARERGIPISEYRNSLMNTIANQQVQYQQALSNPQQPSSEDQDQEDTASQDGQDADYPDDDEQDDGEGDEDTSNDDTGSSDTNTGSAGDNSNQPNPGGGGYGPGAVGSR